MKKLLASLEANKLFLQRFIKFNLVGMVNTLVDVIVFTVLDALGLYFAFAQVISYSVGILNSFLLNKHWTFLHKRTSSGKEMAAFVVINLLSLAASLLLIYTLHRFLALPVLASKLVATGFTLLLNYYGYKRWVFPQPRTQPQPHSQSQPQTLPRKRPQ